MKKKAPLSKETITSLVSLGAVLRKVHNRLAAEGKIRVDKRGKVIFVTNGK
jgi:hypothetical protein